MNYRVNEIDKAKTACGLMLRGLRNLESEITIDVAYKLAKAYVDAYELMQYHIDMKEKEADNGAQQQ